MKWAPFALGLALASPRIVSAAPPSEAAVPANGRVAGRVMAAGDRSPITDATVIVVPAPPDVRSGTRARAPLDPESIDWTRETYTDDDGEFTLEDVPPGKVRVVVLAAGYERLEVWAESGDHAREVLIFLRPVSNRYRTEVAVDRDLELPRPEHSVDGERARSYPGSGGDPVRAAQNLPGVARAPAGLGLVAVRGGDPRQTAIYVDGHPVPRGFHVLPIASVVEPSMIDRVDLTPGNVDAAYGGFSGGLLQIHTLSETGNQGIHGEAHVDLFDVGGAVRAPVGPGGVAVGFRRAHVGDVVSLVDDAIGKTGILIPNYWDYFGRFDMPIRRRHQLSIKAFGAGDTLADTTDFSGTSTTLDFRTSFHRFDLGYAFATERLQASVSSAFLLDSFLQHRGNATTNRVARTPSLRASLSYRLAKRATLLAGVDFVHTNARRQSQYTTDGDLDETKYKYWKFGSWLGVAFQASPKTGLVVIRPQVRLNVFGTTSEARLRVDPRLDVRARVHSRVEVFAAVGQHSAQYNASSLLGGDRLGLIEPSSTPGGHIEIPLWLVSYFDPASLSEAPEGYLLVTRTYQASLGVQVSLPGSVALRSTLFWRETPAETRGNPVYHDFLGWWDLTLRSPAERAYGLEVLLDRRLSERVSGMLGYTLLRAETTENLFEYVVADAKQVPANFDQRHNLVALLVVELPRSYRFGARFRLTSGNPERPVIGTRISESNDEIHYDPIYGEFGSRYGPVFHQLDLRIDKTWYLKRASLVGYLDVQNVYNRIYPEVWVYSIDWTERGQRIGLPIFPSLGFRVEF